jgi:hypothetical protein
MNILHSYLRKFYYFTTMSLKIERGLGDERRAPSRVKAKSFYENLQ